MGGLKTVRTQFEIIYEDKKNSNDLQETANRSKYKLDTTLEKLSMDRSPYPPSVPYLIWMRNNKSFPEWLYDAAKEQDPSRTMEWRLDQLDKIYRKCDIISRGHPLSGDYIRKLLEMIHLQNRIDDGRIIDDIHNVNDLEYLKHLRLPSKGEPMKLHFGDFDEVAMKIDLMNYLKKIASKNPLKRPFHKTKVPHQNNVFWGNETVLDDIENIESGYEQKELSQNNKTPEESFGFDILNENEEENDSRMRTIKKIERKLKNRDSEKESNFLKLIGEHTKGKIFDIPQSTILNNLENNHIVHMKQPKRNHIDIKDYLIDIINELKNSCNKKKNKGIVFKKLKKVITKSEIERNYLKPYFKTEKKYDLVKVLENLGFNISEEFKGNLTNVYEQLLMKNHKQLLKEEIKREKIRQQLPDVKNEEFLKSLAMISLQEEMKKKNETDSEVVDVLTNLGIVMTPSIKKELSKIYERLLKVKDKEKKKTVKELKLLNNKIIKYNK